MRNCIILCVTCGLLAGCGDPLAKVDKLSSVELAEGVGSVGALPDPAEVAREDGVFSGLFSRRQKPPGPVQSQTDAAVTAAISAVAGEETLEDQSVANVETVVEEPANATARRGLFGFMRAKDAGQPATPVAQIVAVEAQTAPETVNAIDSEKQAVLTQAAPAAPQKPRRGLFGLLAGARAQDNAKSADDAPEVVNVRTAALAPVVVPKASEPKASLFSSGRNRKHKGPDAQIVEFGTRLPPGVVARVCDLPSGRLGKDIEKFPTRGRGYTIIDSAPNTTGARPFYVTGFDDKCARTFTAALALFGSPTMHEQLRYGLPSSVQPYSTTDKAYEGIKRSVCGVGKKKPCGAKIKSLEKNTAFISVYDRVGSNAQWSNILLHDGWVLATDRKG